MGTPRAWVFFYGSFMNPVVCATAGATLAGAEVARLPGFDIRVGPLATLVRSDADTVYGVIAAMTHPELARLYSLGWVGSYLPEAVLVSTLDGRMRPAMTYIKHDMVAAPPADDYLDRIIAPARDLGLPSWYLERLERFRAR